MLEDVEKDLIRHEGFRTRPYFDTRGVGTFGHGLTWLTKEESIYLMRNRLAMIFADLCKKVDDFRFLPDSVQEALINMSYQMGVDGVMKFKRMLYYIERKEWDKAADEALDSNWARQTPKRAKEVSGWIREAK